MSLPRNVYSTSLVAPPVGRSLFVLLAGIVRFLSFAPASSMWRWQADPDCWGLGPRTRSGAPALHITSVSGALLPESVRRLRYRSDGGDFVGYWLFTDGRGHLGGTTQLASNGSSLLRHCTRAISSIGHPMSYWGSPGKAS